MGGSSILSERQRESVLGDAHGSREPGSWREKRDADKGGRRTPTLSLAVLLQPALLLLDYEMSKEIMCMKSLTHVCALFNAQFLFP